MHKVRWKLYQILSTGAGFQPSTINKDTWLLVKFQKLRCFRLFRPLGKPIEPNTPWWSTAKNSNFLLLFLQEWKMNKLLFHPSITKKWINNQSLQRLVARWLLNRPSEKYARPLGSFQQVGMKIWNTWNHHLGEDWWGLIHFWRKSYLRFPGVPRVGKWSLFFGLNVVGAEISLLRCCLRPKFTGSLLQQQKKTGESSRSSWWFQPIWKILVKMGIFSK